MFLGSSSDNYMTRKKASIVSVKLNSVSLKVNMSVIDDLSKKTYRKTSNKSGVLFARIR